MVSSEGVCGKQAALHTIMDVSLDFEFLWREKRR
jgi:hypothetical protein